MQKVFTVDQLDICLETLRNDPPKSEGRQKALRMLSPMSYVPQFADNVVAAKGIPLLVQAMEECSKEIQLKGISNDLLGSLTGACKMLGNIANNPGYRTELADAGALSVRSDLLSIPCSLYGVSSDCQCRSLRQLCMYAQLSYEIPFVGCC